jgi:carbohydrate kinase (thermoresistant glucokinase family)
MKPACVIMGVSGAGKSTIGAALAHRIGASFVEGDALHPIQNRDKMAAGIPLSDDDRLPWLHEVATAIRERGDTSVIVACSALKRRYRDLIRAEAGRPVIFVHLDGTEALLRSRLEERTGHFMPATLLASQLAALEPPDKSESHITVSCARPAGLTIDYLARQLEALGFFSPG